MENPEFPSSDVIIFLDGPKTDADVQEVSAVRDYLEELQARHSNIELVIAPKNLGLANSIIQGMSAIFQNYTTAIVVEDDLVLSPHFLEFMNHGLTRFEHVSKVSSVVGYSYPLGSDLPELLCQRGAECWGWATWKDRWERYFEIDASVLLEKINAEELYLLNVYDGYDYQGMLKNCADGKNQSWAVRWHVSNFINHQYSVYPGRSYVQNLGFDASGTHCRTDKNFYEHKVFPLAPVDMNAPLEIADYSEYTSRLSKLFHSETLYYQNKHYSAASSAKKLVQKNFQKLKNEISFSLSSYSKILKKLKAKIKILPPFPTILIVSNEKIDSELKDGLVKIFKNPRIFYMTGTSTSMPTPLHVVISLQKENELTQYVDQKIKESKQTPIFLRK